MAMSSVIVKSFQLSALATALALAGCGGGGNDTLQPAIPAGSVSVTNPSTGNDTTTTNNLASVTNVQLVSPSSQLLMSTDTKVELTVYALDKNNIGVANVPVNIKITDPKLTGVFSETTQSLMTDNTGKATVTLAVKSLTAEQKSYLQSTGIKVDATVGSQTDSKTLTGTTVSTTTPVSVLKDLVLTATDNTLALAVGKKISVTAIAIDKDNNVIPNTPITFDIGSSVLTGVFANSNQTVTTNAKGEATLELEVKQLSADQITYLKSNGLVVKAAGNNNAVQSNTMTIKGVDAADANAQKFDVQAVQLNTPTPNFNIKVGEKITVTASVLNSSNTGLGGVPVSFKLLDDPAVTGVYAVSDTSNVITNASGEATIELEVKSDAFKQKLLSGIKLQATAQNTMGQTPIVKTGSVSLVGVVTDNMATNVSLVNKVLLSSLPTPDFELSVGNKISVTALVADANMGKLSDVPVTFSLPGLETTGIANLSGSTVTTDTQGKATINLEIASLTPTQRAYLLEKGLTINATVPNGTKINPITLSAKPAAMDTEVKSVAVSADSNNILMAVGSKVKLTAVALDKNFGGIAGQTLTVSLPDPASTGIYNITGSTLKTDAKGEAIVELEIKSPLTQAQKDNLLKGLNVSITANNGATGSATLTGKAVNEETLTSLALTASGELPLTIGSQITVTATALDANNGTIANAPVSFTLPSFATYGVTSLSPSTVTTDAQGKAAITLQLQSLTEAQKQALLAGFTITANSNGKTSNIVVKGMAQKTTDDVAAISMITNFSTIEATAGEKLTITTQVRDSANNALANLPVNFTLDDTNSTGILPKSALTNVMTNSNGEATLQLEVSTLSKQQLYYLQTAGLTVKATSGSASVENTFKTTAGVAANNASTLLLTPEFSNIKLAVGNKVKVTALVLDSNNAVVANAPVSLTGLTGTGLSNNTGAVNTTNANGQAVFELEIKDLAAATTALNNGVSLTAQSGAIAVGTTTIFGATSNTNTEAYKFFISQSKPSLRTGEDRMTLTIRVTDTKGGIKAGVPVYLQLLNNATDYGLSFDKASELVTQSDGTVTVDLLQSNIGLISKLDHSASVKVIVNDGTYKPEEETLVIPVNGTTVTDVLTSKVSLAEDDVATVTGTLVDGNAKIIPNTTVELLNNNQPLAAPYIITTDANGKFAFTVSQARLGAAVESAYPLSIRIKGTDKNNNPLQSSPIGLTQLTKIAPNLISLRVLDSTGQELRNNEILVGNNAIIEINTPNIADGQTVYLSTTKGTLSNSTGSGTRVAGIVQGGKVQFNINSSVPNTAQLTLEHNGATLRQFSVGFISQDVQKLLLQVENTTVSTNGQTDIIAMVKDGRDIPLRNAIVEFSILSDASGGDLSTAVARTDDNGQAIISYFAGSNPTANEGVIIGATVKNVSFNGSEISVTPKTAQATLTVQSKATFIGYGFADKVISSADNIYYIQNGSIFVNNNIGQPAANQDVSIAVIPYQFYRGEYYIQVDPATSTAAWAVRHYGSDGRSVLGAITCDNEDSNFNNILDSGEDSNRNGILDPINPITVLSANGQDTLSQTLRTDATGKLDFSIRYGKEYAEWLTATIKVTTLVNGSEYISYRNIGLPTLINDVKLSITEPQRPNWVSPFGKVFNGYDQNRLPGQYCQ